MMKILKQIPLLILAIIPLSLMSMDRDLEAQNEHLAATTTTPQSSEIYRFIPERRVANLTDVVLDSVISKIANDYLMQNAPISLLATIVYGVGGFLTGEFAEMVYKKIYETITGQTLRSTLGTINVLGFEIDNQRLIRRILVTGGLCITLYLKTLAK